MTLKLLYQEDFLPLKYYLLETITSFDKTVIQDNIPLTVGDSEQMVDVEIEWAVEGS